MKQSMLGRYSRVVVFNLLVSMPAIAAIEQREFAHPVEAQRYKSLIEELRCPKCQNQNIADSDAEIAEDLRNEVYRQLVEGKSDQEIVAYLVSRYGEFVHYRPPFDQRTLLLWLSPLILLMMGLVVWLRRFMSKTPTASSAESEVALSAEEQQRLQALLQSQSSPSLMDKSI